MFYKLLALSFGFAPQTGVDHPLLDYFRRQGGDRNFRPVIFGSSVGVFLLFGSLSLPILYLLLSLVIALYLSAGMSWRVHRAREAQIWELVQISPLFPRDILLTTWSAGVGQLIENRLIFFYRLVHGLMLMGLLIVSILFGELAPDQGLMLLVGATLLIIFQPAVEIYFSGMVGLCCATRIRDRAVSSAVAGMTVMIYWTAWVAGVLVITVTNLSHLQAVSLLIFFALLVALPLAIGCAAQYLAEQAL